MDLQELFAVNLKKIRLSQKISQEELGFRASLHRTYISDIERKKRSISLSNIEKISNALGIKAYILFMEDDEKMINTLEEFIEKMNEIAKQGWIKTHRSGTTGIGKTLEDLLGIEENNNSEPDFGNYELKAARITSEGSMLTLFTKAPQPPKVNKTLLENYGYSSSKYSNDKKVLHTTLTAKTASRISNTGKTLKINCAEKSLELVSDDGTRVAFWEKDKLGDAFNKKYKNTLIYVKAKSRNKGKNEEFLFCEAYELSGFDYDGLINLLKEGIVKIDIRIGQYSDGRVHDHGTAFRIHPQYLEKLFKKKKKIWKKI